MFGPGMKCALALFLLAGSFAVAGEGGAVSHGGGHDMAQAEDESWSGDDDAAYLSAMIVHHKAAVKMAEAVAATTKDGKVAGWAKGIIASQQKEIDAMQAMLPGMKASGSEAAAMMEEDMKQMLAAKVSDNPDVNFVTLMIPHHAGAIDMSLPTLVMSDNLGIRALAKDIIVAQSGEILEFRSWLDAKK